MSETIYNLVPTEYYEPPKPKMHKSKHDPNAPLPGSTFGCRGTTRLPGAGVVMKKPGALFGPRYEDIVHKTSFLVKKPTEEQRENTFQYHDRMKPGIPRSDSHPVMGIKTSKNFITANAVEAILAAPRLVEKKEQNFLKKEDYGRVPAYLSQVKEEIRRENEMIDKYVKERMGVQEKDPESVDEFPESERERLIDQLKTKWDMTNTAYQRITHLVVMDSCGMKRKKEELEATLKQLENDIEKLQRGTKIYIKNNA